MKITSGFVFRAVCAGIVGAGLLAAQSADTQADNTKMNKGDASKSAVTADNQNNNKDDRELTRQIRKAVMADKSLSTYGHNVKIVALNGTVTLKGPVRSDEEKKNIEAKAIEIAGGPAKVDDQLMVKASR